MPVEVGCRGFVGQSFWRMVKTLGVQDKKGLCTRAGKEAEAASMWIWRKRDEEWVKV
jgi:hypothetical protein